MIQMTLELVSHLLHLVDSSYAAPTVLFYDDTEIPSSTGVQHGDPLGPAFFCLRTKKLVP